MSNLDGALRSAAENGQLDKVRALLDAGANPRSEPALHFAAEYGHLAVCELLLDRYPDLVHAPNGQASVLEHAAAADQGAVCDLLLARGASPDGLVGGDSRPLDHAVNASAGEAATSLLRAGAQMRDAMPEDVTQLCATRFSPEFAQLCVERGWEEQLRAESGGRAALGRWFAARDAYAAARLTLAAQAPLRPAP